jgi:hypothetical protein
MEQNNNRYGGQNYTAMARQLVDMAVAGVDIRRFIAALPPEGRAAVQKDMSDFATNYSQDQGYPHVSGQADSAFGQNRTRPWAK